MNRLAPILAVLLLTQASCAEDRYERYVRCEEVLKAGRECRESVPREDIERARFGGLTLAEERARIEAGKIDAYFKAGILKELKNWEALHPGDRSCTKSAQDFYQERERREFRICELFVADFDR